jgi:N6-L-threonylcarbamoyladenine synthase
MSKTVNSKMILGLETSCDETSAAILRQENDGVIILSNIIASSASLQANYGGVFPEQAAREQLRLIIPVIKQALTDANVSPSEIDAIAVTKGPGLIGSLLIGVETAKVLASVWNKPLIGVNHLLGHFYANWISKENDWPSFPCIGLLVSGGHTDLVLFKDHGQYEYLGGTRDDAAGECFDKCARMLGYPYPGGPKISKLAEGGNPKAFNLPRPLASSNDFDFSFSGLKTAFSNLLAELKKDDTKTSDVSDLCASIEQAIVDSLIKKTIKACQKYNIEQIIIAGGVAANKRLVSEIKEAFEGTVFVPPPILCTDNAAMIASAAFFGGDKVEILDLQANPNLSLSSQS